jgi:hypothetical protein
MQKRSTPITGPSAWKGPDLEPLEDQWAFRFAAGHIEELERAYAAVEGLPVTAIRKENFRLPLLEPLLARQGQEIESGRGFALLRGLPVADWSLEKCQRVYWGITAHIGRPISQSPLGDMMNAVTDRGFKRGDPNYRANRGRGELFFHSDFADVVGLLCVRPAKSGGVSRLVSAMTVFNELLRTAPQHLDLLYRGFYFYRKKEEAVGSPPVSAEPLPMLSYLDGDLSMMYWPHWAGAATQIRNVPYTPEEQAALDAVNALTRREDLVLNTNFQAGDIQYLNNYKILHSRTDYEDHEEPDRKRYLERLWLCTNPDRQFVPGFADLHGPRSIIDGVARVPDDILQARGHSVSAYAG